MRFNKDRKKFEKSEIEEMRKINYLGAAWLRKGAS
jgi:hypothetical protein